jgi:hypothetical protein
VFENLITWQGAMVASFAIAGTRLGQPLGLLIMSIIRHYSHARHSPVLAEKGIRSKIRHNSASMTGQHATKDTMDATPETNRAEGDTEATLY